MAGPSNDADPTETSVEEQSPQESLSHDAAEPPPKDSVDHRSVTYLTALHNPNIRILGASRAFSKMASATITYGAMVHLAQINASQFEIGMISASSCLAAVLFGFQGGTAADSLSKRIAIAGGHALLAMICLLLPTFLGTGVGDLMLLIFLTSVIMQVVSPGLKAAIALVATPDELATASALVSVVGSAASGIGSALIAPTLINVANIEVVIYAAGLLFAFGAIRAWQLPEEERGSYRARLHGINWRPDALSLRKTAALIVQYRAIATMILISAISVALYEAFNSLLPLYVANVLDEDPANSVYIFAPAGIGLLVGTLSAPRLISRFGERPLATTAMVMMCGGMVLLGLIDIVAPVLAPFSPLRVIEMFGSNPNDRVLAASLISIPLNFGSTTCGASVTNFINRVVPVMNQGATFGIQDVQKNLLALIAVLVVGIIADAIGAQLVMVVAPVLIIGLVFWLLRYSYRSIEHVQLSQREAWDLLRTEPAEP